jgi:hypothetical protein
MNLRTLRMPAFLVALAVLVCAALGMGAAIRAYHLTLVKLPIHPPPGHPLNSMPRETASWRAIGADRLEKGEVLETLGTENYLTRTYAKKRPAAKPGAEPELDPDSVLEFHTAYYTGMIDTVPHVPDRCFVAGGMQLADLTKDVALPLDQTRWRPDPDASGTSAGRLYRIRATDGTYHHLPRDPQDLKLHSMRFLGGGKDLYAGYFFIANGGAVPRAEDVRLLAFDLHSRYAYYIKVQFTSNSVRSEEELGQLAASFLDETFGDLMECAPEWTQVQAGAYPPDNPDKPGATKDASNH